ncbi:ATP-binding protein [Streptomyces sp. NPDC048297]|uniref:ATP-binding protein n=1 Tax=Streptomyces sp. NPDC048297 TaxID=3365531 RepID=UPI003710B0D9
MSQLRAPAARADRREGGRHGRPVARPAPALPETHIRPQLMRLAVLPPVAVALSASAAVIFSIRSTGTRTGLTLWAVLAGAVAVTLAGILIAAVAADRAARSVSDRVEALRSSAARGEADLRALVEALRNGTTPPQRRARRKAPEHADDFELLAADLARAHDGAVTAVVQAAQLSSQAGSEQKLEVFVNLARRLQSLVHREISILDDLENEIEDPDLLKGLFHVDHLATRIRRHAENLAVLGGAVSRRQWSNPVSMTEVLRSAIAEVEQYSRVKLVPPIDGELRGHAVADVIHLLAELVENATVFSAPHTQVLLRANLVTSGLAVEVEDRGLGMPVGEQARMNALLADPDQVNVASLLADGRIGLYVVSQLARRHGIGVRLQTNIYGGVQAVLVVPQALLGTAPGVLGVVGGAVESPRDPVETGQLAVPVPVPVPQQVRGQEEVGQGAGQGVGAAPASGGGAQARRTGWQNGVGPDGAGQPAATGRRRHAQNGGASSGGPRSNGAGSNGAGSSGAGSNGAGSNGAHSVGMRSVDARSGGTPPPLPVRGAQEHRPNPAEAVPGVSREHLPVVEAHAGILPTPRDGTVRGTMGKPQLPRRRAQEHIVPQLRGGPAPRQDGDTVAGHDPGLMAAFQRGIGLAEAQQHLESMEPTHTESYSTGEAHPMGEAYSMGETYTMEAPHTDAGHMAPVPVTTAHVDATHVDATHVDAGHTEAAVGESAPMEAADTEVAVPMEAAATELAAPMDSVHTDSVHTAAEPTRPAALEPLEPARVRPAQHAEPAPVPQPHAHVPASASEGAGRADGSEPAG